MGGVVREVGRGVVPLNDGGWGAWDRIRCPFFMGGWRELLAVRWKNESVMRMACMNDGDDISTYGIVGLR